MSTDNEPTNLLAEVQDQLVSHFEVELDAQMWFGEESKSWTHEERCRRLADALDSLWRDKGGEGAHPVSARYRSLA